MRHRVLLGQYSEPPELQAPLEQKIGRAFVGTRTNRSLSKTDNAGLLIDTLPGNKHPYRNTSTNLTRDGYDWAMIRAGKADATITALANAIKADCATYGWRRFLHSFHHEQKVDTAVEPGGGLPTDYAAAYHRVRQLFDQAGATHTHGGPVYFCFITTHLQYNFDPADPWYVDNVRPAPADYDLGGTDLYNRLDASGQLILQTAKIVDKIADYWEAQGKPWMIGEWACDEATSGTTKAQWMDDFFGRASLRSGFHALYVTNKQAKGQDYPPDSSPEALSVFKRWANDATFRGGLA